MHLAVGASIVLVVLALVSGTQIPSPRETTQSSMATVPAIAASANVLDEQPSCPDTLPPVIRTGHYLIAWGANDAAQLGDGSTIHRDRAMFIPYTFPADALVQVAAGGRHSLALLSDGSVWAWGANESGQLGLRNNLDQLEPTEVTGILGRVLQIAAGDSFSLARVDDGTVWAWGANATGQLGSGDTADRAFALPVVGPDGHPLDDIFDISAGRAHGLA